MSHYITDNSNVILTNDSGTDNLTADGVGGVFIGGLLLFLLRLYGIIALCIVLNSLVDSGTVL